MAVLFHVNMDRLDKSEKFPLLKFDLQSSRAVCSPQSMVTCPSTDVPLVHPPLLGCTPLNTCDLIVLYDNGMSRIDPETNDKTASSVWRDSLYNTNTW